MVSRWTSGRRAYAAAALACALATAAFFYPLALGDTYGPLAGLQNYYFPWAATPTGVPLQTSTFDYIDTTLPFNTFIRDSLADGHLPLWNPTNHAGTPFITNSVGFALYPPRMLLVSLFSPGLAHDLFVVLHVFLSGLAMFALMRRFTPRFLPAVFGATAWMFSSNTFSWAQHEFMLVLAVFLPTAMALLHRAAQRRSWGSAALAGIALGLGVIGSSLQVAGPMLFIAGLYAAALAWQEWRRREDRTRRALASLLGRPAVAFFVGGAVAAPVVLPTLLLSLDLQRAPIPVGEMEAVPLRNFLHAFVPNLPDYPFGLEVVLFQSTYVGAVAGLLALIAMFTRRPGTGLGRSLAIGMVLVCTGTIVTAIPYHLVPGFQYMAPLGRILNFWCFAVALLGGIGLARLMDIGDTWNARSNGRSATPVLVVAVIALALNTALGALYARQITPKYAPRTDALQLPDTPIIDALTAGRPATGQPQRYLSVLGPAPNPDEIRLPLVASMNMLYGLDAATGYDSFADERTSRLWRIATGETREQALAPDNTPLREMPYASNLRWDLLPRLGVTTLLSPPGLTAEAMLEEKPDTVSAPPLVTRYDGGDGHVVDLRTPPPRAFVVTGAEVVEEELDSLDRFLEPAFSWRGSVILEQDEAGDVAAPPGEGPAASTARDGPNDLAATVSAPEPGWLVVTESFGEGWSATVNGEETPILHGDHAFRAVKIPAGDVDVEFIYRPPGWYTGLVLLAVGAAVCIAIAATSLRRRRLSRADVMMR